MLHIGLLPIYAKLLKMKKEDPISVVQKHLQKPIVIIGMMGAGKTTLGRSLAKTLNMPFYDSDLEIEKDTGRSVSAIFEWQGEAFFRQKEKEKIAELLQISKGVISIGGGAITNPETADAIFSKSLCVWVDAPINILVERTSQKGNRPLLNGLDPEVALTERMNQRRHLYEKAHLQIDGSSAIKKVTKNAIGQISEYLLKNTP